MNNKLDRAIDIGKKAVSIGGIVTSGIAVIQKGWELVPDEHKEKIINGAKDIWNKIEKTLEKVFE